MKGPLKSSYIEKKHNHYVNKMNLEWAKKYLRKEKLNISDISDKLRFSSPRYFYEVFKKLTGITTKEYRNEFES